MLSSRIRVGAGGERLRDLVERLALDLDRQIAWPRAGARRPRRREPAARRWLSLTRTPSSRPKRWFRPPPQRRRTSRARAGRGSSCACRGSRARSGDRVDVAPRQRRDSGEPAEEVERGSLAGEDRRARTRDTRATGAGSRRAPPPSTSRSNRSRVERPEDRLRGREPADDTRAPSAGAPRSRSPSSATVASVVTSPLPTSSASAGATTRSSASAATAIVSKHRLRAGPEDDVALELGSLGREVDAEVRRRGSPRGRARSRRCSRDEQVRRACAGARARPRRGRGPRPAQSARRSSGVDGLARPRLGRRPADRDRKHRARPARPARPGGRRRGTRAASSRRGGSRRERPVRHTRRRRRGPRQLGAPVEVGDDAADRVVRRRRDRDRHRGGVVARLLERVHQGREAAAVDRAQVEQRRAARGDRARDDVPRRELVGEPLPALVEQERALRRAAPP